ncbi:NADH-quinone oxidoreductase subunit E 2 [Burkholderiales bacterium]|nr:NADH-quinone oxidoreductase subunit E 2 [Burkholderiales bacterium]
MSAAANPAVSPGYRLSEQALRLIDREIAKYPAGEQQSAVIAALAIAQDEIGWLPSTLMEEVARYLQMAPVAVYEVATFYHMFQLAPVGRHKITICTNLPCALSGANSAARRLQEKLGIGFGQTTADGRFTLQEGECMGACGDAPVLLVNNKQMCSFLDEAKIDALLQTLAAEQGK